jgi:hypothetical protein
MIKQLDDELSSEISKLHADFSHLNLPFPHNEVSSEPSSLDSVFFPAQQNNTFFIRVNTYPLYKMLDSFAKFSEAPATTRCKLPVFSPLSFNHLRDSNHFLQSFLSPFYIVMHVASGDGAKLPGLVSFFYYFIWSYKTLLELLE